MQTILIVDDDKDIRIVLRLQLEGEGYYVFEASSGQMAIQKTKDYAEIDLIILDIMMPGISGTETCREIREHTMAPILFLTARCKDNDRIEAYKSGGDGFLVKPFSNVIDYTYDLKGLEISVEPKLCHQSARFRSDSRYLNRMLDNLFSNIKKSASFNKEIEVKTI